jgi:ABC-2 type transport system permease protein
MLDALVSFKKYLQVFKLSFEESVFYRANTFAFFLRQTLWFFAEILIWLAVFQQKSQLGGYDLATMITYFLLVYLISLFTGSSIDGWLSENIISGGLTRFFLIPVSVHWVVFFQDLGRKLSRFLWVFVIWIIAFFIFNISVSGSNLALFLLSLFNSILLVFLFRFFIGLLAFWFISIRSLAWIIGQLESFLGGGSIPLSFLPLGVAKVAGFSPFGLSLSFPIRLFQNRIDGSEIYISFLLQYLWIVSFYFFIHFLWKKGVKKYEAVGN